MLILLAAAVNLFSFGIVYGLAWVLAWILAWLIGQFVPVPAWLQSVLPWFLFELHLVVGLWLAGDLRSARRAVLRLGAITAAAGAVIGALVALQGGRPILPTIALWTAAGVLPWAAALLSGARN